MKAEVEEEVAEEDAAEDVAEAVAAAGDVVEVVVMAEVTLPTMPIMRTMAGSLV